MVNHLPKKLLFLSVIFFIGFKTATSDSGDIFMCNNYDVQKSYRRINTMNNLYKEDIENLENKRLLQKLKLTKPNIRNIDEDLFEGFTNLTHLTIINSKIQEIERNAFSHLPNLEFLDLSENRLSKLFDYIFEDMTKLQKLILNWNDIKTIDSSEFSNLTNLRELQIKRNQLKSIYATTFIGLTHVEIIDLSKNPIAYIQLKSFDSCRSLKQLIIENTEHLVIQSLWSSPSNFELSFVNSGSSVEDLLKVVVRNQDSMAYATRNLGPNYYNNNKSSGIQMPMIIILTVAVVFIIIVAIGISIFLKKKYNKKNNKYEVAIVNNGMYSTFVIQYNMYYKPFFF